MIILTLTDGNRLHVAESPEAIDQMIAEARLPTRAGFVGGVA